MVIPEKYSISLLEIKNMLPADLLIENIDFCFLLGEDLKKEISQLEKAVFNTFIKDGKPPIYEPDQFYSFCKTANAGNVFNFILSSISSDRH